MPNDQHTAFVLSGGGSLGAIQAGMLRALYERGIAPDLIIGTSAGALNATFIASRPQTGATAEELAGLWRGLNRADIFPLHPLTGLLGFLGRRDHLVSPRGLRRLLDDNLQFRRLEDAPIPVHVIATDISSGEEQRLSRGDAAAAVLASAAIPGVFPPVELEGRTLVDGGVANNTPIAHAVELGVERVYVLTTGYACSLRRPPSGALEMLLQATSLLIMRRLIIEIEHLGDAAELIVMPPPCPLEVTPTDFDHAEELIDGSYRNGVAYLEAVSEGAGGVPLSMRIHGHEPVTAGA